MTFSEFEAGAMSVENIAGCRVELVGELVAVMTESYLADSDGTTVERGRGFAEMTPETLENRRPGRWLLSPFDRAIADQHQGFTRYATRDEIVKYQAAKDAQEKESSL